MTVRPLFFVDGKAVSKEPRKANGNSRDEDMGTILYKKVVPAVGHMSRFAG